MCRYSVNYPCTLYYWLWCYIALTRYPILLDWLDRSTSQKCPEAWLMKHFPEITLKSILSFSWLLQISSENYLDLLFLCSELPYFTLVVYVLCYFATTLILRTQSISDVAYDLPWYRMSTSQQLLVQVIIQRTQRSFEFKALGVLVCSLESFSKVKDQLLRMNNDEK